ncbi:hypothetical protein C8R47DRAFT_101851 [Mycena vitilis]|nr:hypothetical protein C8R47DRAFT_101851 [Mycena vitilis]
MPKVVASNLIMQLYAFLSLFAVVHAVVVPTVDSSGHFHSQVPSDIAPQGKNITINGVLTYVSLPKGKFDPTKVVLMLTDVFGLPSPDNLVTCNSRQPIRMRTQDETNMGQTPSSLILSRIASPYALAFHSPAASTWSSLHYSHFALRTSALRSPALDNGTLRYNTSTSIRTLSLC